MSLLFAGMHQTLFPEMLKEYGDRIAFVYKDFPLAEIHPWAIHAAVDANCLATQNNDAYWDFADYIHANQSDVNSEKGRDAQFAALDRIAPNKARNTMWTPPSSRPALRHKTKTSKSFHEGRR